MKNIQGALSWFVRPKIKLFALMFRRIPEVLRLQGLQRKFWTNFHDLCIRKRSCLLWSSDAFGKFPLARLIKKLWVHFHDLCLVSRKQTFLTSTFCKNALATFYNFTRPQIFAVLFGHILKFLIFTFCKNALNLNTFVLRVHPQIMTCECDFMGSNFKKVLDWQLRHVL